MAKQAANQNVPMISVSIGLKELITIATIAMSPFAAFVAMLKTVNDTVVADHQRSDNIEQRVSRLEHVFDKAIDEDRLRKLAD